MRQADSTDSWDDAARLEKTDFKKCAEFAGRWQQAVSRELCWVRARWNAYINVCPKATVGAKIKYPAMWYWWCYGARPGWW